MFPGANPVATANRSKNSTFSGEIADRVSARVTHALGGTLLGSPFSMVGTEMDLPGDIRADGAAQKVRKRRRGYHECTVSVVLSSHQSAEEVNPETNWPWSSTSSIGLRCGAWPIDQRKPSMQERPVRQGTRTPGSAFR